MPLQPISITSESLAQNATRPLITQMSNIANSIINLRTKGITSTSTTPEVTPTEIDAAFGETNIAILNIWGASLNQSDLTKLASALAELA